MNNLYIMNLAIADFIIGLVKGANDHVIIHMMWTTSFYRISITQS